MQKVICFSEITMRKKVKYLLTVEMTMQFIDLFLKQLFAGKEVKVLLNNFFKEIVTILIFLFMIRNFFAD